MGGLKTGETTERLTQSNVPSQLLRKRGHNYNKKRWRVQWRSDKDQKKTIRWTTLGRSQTAIVTRQQSETDSRGFHFSNLAKKKKKKKKKKGGQADVIVMDFRKVFYKVDHQRRLHRLGINHGVIQSFSDRLFADDTIMYLAIANQTDCQTKLILVLFVRLFCLCLFRFVGFLFLLGSGKGCGL